MRVVDRRTGVTRRVILRGSALAVPGAAAAMAISPKAAWAQAAKNLTPATMATLARAARDIYPHDQLADAYYVTAVSSYDSAAPAVRDLMTKGCAGLDAEAHKRHGTPYLGVGSEDDRLAILKGMQAEPFFQTLRSGLVVSLYNQKPLWTKFGYEGSSADKGGYIHRGFNDIDWLS
ncbi:MAG TPA: gluconate 2-dehydrogenase subunit 3 family protein, partial [Rhodopila sp.]|nr:gluconate 2-dehydrogenase subunit 3 family protein [Rhodopila sp.]